MAFKTFTAGSVLTAADVNDYLMEQVVIACTSGTRPGSPNEGMTIYETDTDRYAVHNGTDWVYPLVSVTKTSAAQSVTSSTTITDMTGVAVPLIRNETYFVSLMCIYDGATAGDIKWGWSTPSGSTWEWFADAITNAAASGVEAVARTYQDTGTPSGGALGAGSFVFANPRGIIRMSSTSDNLQARFAQLASSGTATRVHPGTTLTAWRLK